MANRPRLLRDEGGHVENLRTWRPVIMGNRGAVVSNHPLATRAGYEVLQAGGCAADAAVAVAVMLAVVEPNMSGVGGDGFFLVWDVAGQAGSVIHACGQAPADATPERYSSGIPLTGLLSASVPGVAAGWEAMRMRFGNRSRSELYAGAIEHARNGFPATRRLCDFVQLHAANLALDPPCAETYLPGGHLPGLGATIRNVPLARTLQTLAGSGPDALYRGEIGQSVARTAKAMGGLITPEDLAAHETEVIAPITSSYRDLIVLEAGPTSMGFTLLEELNIVEQFDLAAMGHLSADAVHLLVEAKKLAFADRERYAGDPRFVQAPFDRLLDKAYAKALAGRIDMHRAAPSTPGRPTPSGETTYFAVVDRAGNAVSGIQSLGAAFGSCVMDPHTGILLNNRMTWWHLEPGHPNRLVPGKRVRQTMNPPLALQGGTVRYVWGTPGGDSQLQVNLQVLTAMVDFGLDPQQAVEAARWDHFQPDTSSVFPHLATSELVVEERASAQLLDALRARGHAMRVISPLDGPCSAEVIARRPDGLLLCASDPRRDGWAAAF